MEETLKIDKITKIQNETRNGHPILLNFQSGDMSFEDPARLDCIQAKDKSKEDNKKMAIVSTSSNVYKGYVDEGYPKNLIETYVAIKCKKTGKVELIQVHECSMISTVYDKNDEIDMKFQKPDGRITLLKQFGGKQAIRYVDRIEKTKINADIIKDQVQDAVDGIDESFLIDADDKFAKTQVERDMILQSVRPPINMEATSAFDLYDLNSLMSQKLLDHLDKIALVVLKAEMIDLPFNSVYLANYVKAAQQSKEPDSIENIRTVKLCIFLDGLTKIINFKYNENFERKDLSKFSVFIESELRQQFSLANHTQFIKTKYTCDKAICYYLAGTFMLENFDLNIDKIHHGLKVSKDILMKYAQFIGGIQNTRTGKFTLSVKAAKEPPKTRFMSKKRKR